MAVRCSGCCAIGLLTVAGILLFFIGSLFVKRGIGSEFFPDSDESQFQHHLQDSHRNPSRAHRTSHRATGKYCEEGTAPIGSGDKVQPIYTTQLSDTACPGRTAIFSQNTGPMRAACRSIW